MLEIQNLSHCSPDDSEKVKRWILLSGNDSVKSVVAIHHWRLRRLVRYLDANIDKPMPLGRAAEISGLERTYFSRFFQAQTGMKFSNWIRRVRVQRAKYLLAKEHRSISAVSTAVGYKDIGTFERHFRRCEGISPIEYRENVRQQRIDAKSQ